jgi:membrane protein implicated in regulation of membrane protease activity
VFAFLIVAALIAGLLGILQLTQATAGVGFLAGACLLAILARIAQAHIHHQAVETQPQPEPALRGQL